MSISAKDVMKLREATGAGMMDCKKALTEADGDFDRAVEILRKKGQQVSEKRADREANQGLILINISDDHSKAAAIEVNCETDFVARNDDFQASAQSFLDVAFEKEIGSIDELKQQEIDGLTIAKHLDEMVGKIGEKIKIGRVLFIESSGDLVKYIHPGNQLGVIVEFESSIDDADVAKDVAMQIAAMNPLAVTRDGVDTSIVEKELEIAKEQLLNEGKPAEIAEKASQGKLRRFYEERVLLEQKFVKDNGISVKEYLEQNDAPLVRSYHRLQLGEA
ncbi:translation elongation factor Ts [Rhodohalobacter sulfatireducens]|uniref:Elongation factor Ts n=1 Tax=Rhodohalobacter sulfatireducens TaxID=2911366 RepID=A0ABS9KGG3_9BACT|nr:translation elongation factor Ts [Rhodohalobacter sulfatireducens]MCG2589926.1 translation elongation factor Ts [Rhodohalobacter sulfatireducens]